MKRTTRHNIRKALAALGLAGFLLMLGSVGALEIDAISLTRGAVQFLIGFAVLGVCAMAAERI
mgnify:CR=1 FL=1